VKLPDVSAAGIVNELPDSCRKELLLDTDTSIPPDGAASFSVTVHVAVAPEVRLPGVQDSWETETICARAACAENNKIKIRVGIRACLSAKLFPMVLVLDSTIS
jgi:hypothetical protein